MLTKSLYAAGLQCPKLLWYKTNRPQDVPAPSDSLLARFDQGNLVNEYARKRYPGGIMVESIGRDSVVALTKALLEKRVPLFEAGFLSGEVYVRVDVLVPADGGWDIVEVKSGTSVKPENIVDVAFQKYCLEKAGLHIRKCFIMHLNKEYVRQGDLDLEQLFTLVDVSAEIDTSVMDAQVEALLNVQTQSEHPVVPIGPQCSAPYECPMKGLCWAFLPKYNVTEFYFNKKIGFKMLERGILDMKDVPQTELEKNTHRIQQAAVAANTPYIDHALLRGFLSKLEAPVAYMDFETVNRAIPPFDNTWSYEQIPFQFSIHTEDKHREFLHRSSDDPRPAFVAALKAALPASGAIVVHNKTFENSRLVELSKLYPEYDDWVRGVLLRIVDLKDAFTSFAYYHPDQHGSCSIKDILPALTNVSYDGLTIGNGDDASGEWWRATHENTPEEERERIYRDLLTYCKLDTHAMVEIVNVLRAAAK